VFSSLAASGTISSSPSPPRSTESTIAWIAFLLPLELAAFLEIAGEVLEQEEEVGQESEQPEGRSYFRHFFGVLVEDLNLGEYVQIIKEPIEQKEPPDDDVEDIVDRHVGA